MHTRGKGQNTSEEAQHEDQVESDDDDHENHNSTKKHTTRERRSEDRASVRSDSSKRTSSKRSSVAESNEVSPVLSNSKAPKSSTRKKNFVSDILPEDTPLALRRSLGSEPRRKRLMLATTEEVPEAGEEQLDNSVLEDEEDDGYDANESAKTDKHLGDEEITEKVENPDGVRRSQRTRKTNQSYNDSWIFGDRTAKGYPTIKEDDESERIVRRRSLRVRSHVIEHEEEDDEEQDDVELEEDVRRETKRSTRSSAVSSKDSSKRSMRYESNLETSDMYSRVKRGRVRSSGPYSGYESTVRNAKKASSKKSYRKTYDNSSEESDEESESDEEDFEEAATTRKRKPSPVDHNGEEDASNQEAPSLSNRVKGKYCLRRIQPVERYQPIELKPGSRNSTPPRSRASRHSERIPCSPAMRSQKKRRQKAQNESTTSSSSSDEERFERRKNKSMTKARNRCLPMNFSPDDLAQGVMKDRMKVGSSLADVDPMKVDRDVNFSHVGGLETYIRSLKEMILFPLLYPEIFQKFSIQPPRGVLFYGPPGTGKTLVARCLANECSQKDRRVAFFMRKGADCLSKWVGESERQLRLLFDQAFQMRPSIIFFDEIDGLAPVRSTRQDQIHSSIVSTLLALMDGLDARGEVIVIGATNRLDAIDPALRRPGRFDREFHFPLPSMAARKEILDIHLKSWTPSPAPSLINYLSQKTVGYCGADLKALCAEAALLALRRRYPQVYQSKDKLQLDLNQINVERRDFDRAIQRLVPASQRSATGSGKPLTGTVVPLLENQLQSLVAQTQTLFPEGMNVLKQKGPLNGLKKQTSNQLFPRLLISGGSCAHLASALLHHMERLPVHKLDLSTLHGLSARSPEEACVQLFHEARRNVPAVIYLPVVNRWWPVISDTVKAAFLTQLSELDPELPVLLLVTEDSGSRENCPDELSSLFDEQDGEVFVVREFSDEERRKFLRNVLLVKCVRPPLVRQVRKENLEVLPVAAPPPPRELNDKEKERLEKKEEATLRELRIFLREILAKMARNKLFYVFTRPVDTNEVPDYLDIIKQPMDLETMMTKIDLHAYESAKDFLADIELIVANALEYNPDRNPEDKQIRHRACTLRDTAYALIKAEMDTDFEEHCQEISKARKERKSKIATVVGAPLHPDDVIQATTEPQPETGASNKKAVREKNGKYKKNPAKKRKIDSVDETSEKSLEVSVETPAETERAADEVAEVKDEPEPAEVTVMDDTQTSDADPPPDADQEAASTTSKPKKSVAVDVQKLEELLDALVFITKGWSAEKLLRLYTKLAKLADRYAKLWDRSGLVKDIEELSKRI